MKARKRILKETFSDGRVQYRCQRRIFIWWRTMKKECHISNMWTATADAIFETYEEAIKFLGVENRIVNKQVEYDSKF